MSLSANMVLSIAVLVTGSAIVRLGLWVAYQQYRRERPSNMQRARSTRDDLEGGTSTQVSAN